MTERAAGHADYILERPLLCGNAAVLYRLWTSCDVPTQTVDAFDAQLCKHRRKHWKTYPQG